MSKDLLKDKKFILGIIIILIFMICAIFPKFIAPYDPLEINPENKLQGFSKEHVFGTDNIGRDVLSRIIYGTRITLFSSIVVTLINLLISVPIGIISGYFGGYIDIFISRIIDIILAFPSLIVSLYILATFGPGLSNLIFSLTLVGWARYARIIRGLVISIKEKTYIKSAVISGCSNKDIIFSHIIYNTISPIILLASLDIGSTILSISGLSFLGLGINPPTPEWGVILNDSKPFIESHPHLLVIPSICIFCIVVAFNLVSNAMEENIKKGGV